MWTFSFHYAKSLMGITNPAHEFAQAVYYNGMPDELYLHSCQYAFFKASDLKLIWFSPKGDPYLYGVRVVVDDRVPCPSTLDVLVKRSRAIQRETNENK
jgi:hypothetical protein